MENQEKLKLIMQNQMSDHDLLITLNTKFDGLTQDIKQNTDGLVAKIADHEVRIKAAEKLHDELQPLKTAEQVKINTQWIHDFKLTYRIVVGIAAAVGGMVGFILALLTQINNLFVK